MAMVYIPSSLAMYAEGERFVVFAAKSLEEILQGLGDRYPDFRNAVFDQDGELRPHIRVFVNDRGIEARSDLRTAVGEGDEVVILSAIAGG